MDAEQFIEKFRAAYGAIERRAREQLAPLPDDGDRLTGHQTEAYLMSKVGVGREHTLRQWRVEGRGPTPTKVKGRIFYRKRDLREWMAARSTHIPTTPRAIVEEAARRAIGDTPECRRRTKRNTAEATL